MDSKSVCSRLIYSESEIEVTEIIHGDKALSDTQNWFPVDDRDSNFNVITNQASVGSKALTELCTNMVDAVLLKHAWERDINPRGPNAPTSMIEAVKELVQLNGARNGILAEVDDPKYLKEFAERNLIIGVTGGTKRSDALCFTFVDNGEGQHAHNFKDTFLSLSAGNKSDIKFVQGKYNMGSSGVMSYCGRCWYKLIVSRRWDHTGDWGWTLMRRRPNEGKPVAEYFTYMKKIPTFKEENLFPLKMQNGTKDELVSLNTGTVIKLYQYHMESNATFSKIRDSLNENLISTILPIKFIDYRVKPERKKGKRRALGIDEKPLNGLEFSLRNEGESGLDMLEDGTVESGKLEHIGNIDDPLLGTVRINAMIFMKGMPRWLKQKTQRVYHSVNGQVQYKQTRGFLSQTCKLPVLKDLLVLIVDASDLTEEAHNEVWKGDRENIRRTEFGQRYLSKITDVISDSQSLKELQLRVAEEETRNVIQKQPIHLFQSMVRKDPSIAQLLPGGEQISISKPKIPDEKPWIGKYSPSFLEIRGKKMREEGAKISIEGRRVVSFDTDVVNDYLVRADNRGEVFIDGLDGKLSWSSTLKNGRLTVNFTVVPDKVRVHDRLDILVHLFDNSMPQEVSASFLLEVVTDRQTTPPGPPPGPPKPKTPKDIDDKSLPKNMWITEDGRRIEDMETKKWPDGFNALDGGYITDLNEGVIYYINYDNVHLQRFLRVEQDSIKKKAITEQFRLGMLVLMMGFEHAYESLDNTKKNSFMDYKDDIRKLSARGAATVVLSVAKTIPEIVNPFAVAAMDDD